jgi:hypothetical protein
MLVLQGFMFENMKGILYKTENHISLVCKIRISDFVQVFLLHTI